MWYKICTELWLGELIFYSSRFMIQCCCDSDTSPSNSILLKERQTFFWRLKDEALNNSTLVTMEATLFTSRSRTRFGCQQRTKVRTDHFDSRIIKIQCSSDISGPGQWFLVPSEDLVIEGKNPAYSACITAGFCKSGVSGGNATRTIAWPCLISGNIDYCYI